MPSSADAPTPRWRWASLAVTFGAAVAGVAALALHGQALEVDAAAHTQAPPSRTTFTDLQPFGRGPTIDPDAPFPHERSRRVLALYDSSETVENADAPAGAPRELPISTETALAHRLAELPLNHLGLAVDFWDVNGERLPSPNEMARYLGVLSWFGDQRLRRPDAYLRWLLEQLHAGRKVVMVEGLGAHEDLSGHPASPALVDEVFTALGARWLAGDSHDSSQITVTSADPKMTAFEAPMPHQLDYYAWLRALPGTRVHLRMALTDTADSVSDVLFTSRAGGFALQTLVWRDDRIADRWVTRWLIDPFRFFATAFGLEGVPRSDFTTLNGSRIFYSQIDGDGMDTISEIDYASRCGELVRDRVLKRYDLPFTASVVVGFTAPPPLGKGQEKDVEVARSIFALDNVEVASHGYAHPLNWRAPDGEVAVVGLPGYRMSGESEIALSVEYIDRELVPPGKRCRAMLWTGDCNPTAEVLAVAFRLGLRNLNGGDPRMDAHYPSYAHLVAPIHRVGGWPQYFTSAANDYILTDEWKPPYYRFRNVLQTFRRSGSPRRVVPVDVYFHFYSARNQTALTALEEVFDWVAREPLAPVFASEYVDIVRDAQSARLALDAPGRWRVRKGPSLRTVRFDELVHVDVARSQGVLGYLQEPSLGATYVHLDGSREAVIELAQAAPSSPYLERATHWVDEMQVSADAIELVTHGPGPRRFQLGGLVPEARFRLGDAVTVVDGTGRLSVVAPSRADTTRLRVVRVP